MVSRNRLPQFQNIAPVKFKVIGGGGSSARAVSNNYVSRRLHQQRKH